MKIFLTTLGILPLAYAGFHTNVCFKVGGEGVEGALVKCYDEDWGTDDRVGNDVYTDINGCISTYEDGYDDWWNENPDVYCQIFPNGECFAGTTTSIKEDHNPNNNANFGTLDLTYDEAYCGDFGADTNGCGPASFPSWLNDAATDVSGFAAQCAVHDACYGDCTKTRSECDDDFFNDMLNVCATSWTCETLAHIYYAAVNTAGQGACEAARTTNCDATGFNRCSQ